MSVAGGVTSVRSLYRLYKYIQEYCTKIRNKMCYFDGKLQKSKTQFTDIAENLIHKIKILRIFYHLARNFAHSAHKKQSPTACRCDAQWGWNRNSYWNLTGTALLLIGRKDQCCPIQVPPVLLPGRPLPLRAEEEDSTISQITGF